MDSKIKLLFYALLDYLDIKENDVLEDSFSISDTIDNAYGEPFIRELNIKLRYIDKEELKAFRDEEGAAKEG